MEKRIVSGLLSTLLLLGTLTLALNTQPAKASGTIYIRPDGTVEGTDKIQRDGDVYTFTDNIYDGIVVEIDNIVVDGAGYSLQGMGSGEGIQLVGRSNVTIKSIEIKSFYYGIGCGGLNNSISGNNIKNNRQGISLGGSNHVICGNNITANSWAGIYHHGSNHVICGNNITANSEFGIRLLTSSRNSIFGNNIKDNYFGVRLDYSSNYNNLYGNTIRNNDFAVRLYKSSDYNSIFGNIIESNGDGVELTESSNYNSIFGNTIRNNRRGVNCWLGSSSKYNKVHRNNLTNNKYAIILEDSDYNNISGNDIANNEYGMWLRWISSGNIIYHNNLVDNAQQVYGTVSENVWDDGYPSGGNYWSDHVTVDDYSGMGQDELGSDGIVDEPYIIDDYNRDHYPLVEPWSPVISATIDIDPDTLNLHSKGQWITAYIQLPIGYSPEDVDATTITLNETIQPVLDPKYDFVTNSSEYLVDHNGDGILERMIKFNRAEVASWICGDLGIQYGDVTLTLTGELCFGTPFEGTVAIRVLFPGDVDGDGYVGSADAGVLTRAYGTSSGNPLYVPEADFDEDGYIGSADAGILSANYGKTAS